MLIMFFTLLSKQWKVWTTLWFMFSHLRAYKFQCLLIINNYKQQIHLFSKLGGTFFFRKKKKSFTVPKRINLLMRVSVHKNTPRAFLCVVEVKTLISEVNNPIRCIFIMSWCQLAFKPIFYKEGSICWNVFVIYMHALLRSLYTCPAFTYKRWLSCCWYTK